MHILSGYLVELIGMSSSTSVNSYFTFIVLFLGCAQSILTSWAVPLAVLFHRVAAKV